MDLAPILRVLAGDRWIRRSFAFTWVSIALVLVSGIMTEAPEAMPLMFLPLFFIVAFSWRVHGVVDRVARLAPISDLVAADETRECFARASSAQDIYACLEELVEAHPDL